MAKRAVVIRATPSLLPVNISGWLKREGTGTGRRERELKSERKEKMKREEREKGIYNNKIFATSVRTVANLQWYCSHVV